RNVPKKPAPASLPPDDGPEDMELTIPMKPAPPLNLSAGLFDEEAKKRFGGLNARPSAFERGTLFHTETE
ncbi:MAG: hypothetical protein LBB57_00595, partial [Clostridiales Family XIII bacterium]|nr:hypothetical protein [Clostridiales Family XIII bacterium]